VSPSSRRRALRAALLLAVAGALIAAPAASAGLLSPESGGSPNADSIRTLYNLIGVIAIIVFVGVEGTLFYSFFKFRARKGRVAAQIHGNTRLEIGWTVGAAAILIFLTVFTFIQLPEIKNPPASDIDANGNPVSASNAAFASTDQKAPPKGSPSLNIRVDGQQYVWRYQYPGRERVFSYVDMVVPAGMTVTLDITADDVAHSWWIPALGGKMDALPGYTNKTWFKVPLDAIPEGARQKVFHGQCAELCGRNHANMVARVIAMRYDDWKAWYDGEAREIKRAQEEAASQRRQVQEEQSGAGTPE
jgi:cytochrome c oxidase subunit 2